MDNIQKWANIKTNRNYLLQITDWCVLPDSPLTAEQLVLIKEYRQKLRDITKDFDNPDDVVFPQNPLE
jgi:hypothetical protein